MQPVETCSICLEELDATGSHRALQLHCGHIYGQECIDQWLTINKSCPLCFKEIVATPPANANTSAAVSEEDTCVTCSMPMMDTIEDDTMMISPPPSVAA